MSSASQTIAIVGPGAIGCVVGARLAARTSHDVTLCGRQGFDSVELDGPDGRVSAALRPLLDPRQAPSVDWVLFAVKSHQTAGAAPWLDALVRPGTTVAILQNGVEHVDRLAPFVDRSQLLPVIVQCPATAVAPGRVVQRAPAELVVPPSSTGHGFRALLAGTAITVTLAEDFVSAAWRKLCSNAAAGAITALTGKPVNVTGRPDVAELARGLVEECMAVGRAEGARFPPDFVDRLLAAWQAAGPEATTSMLQDRRAGRPLEHDARNAVVVRLAGRHGIATPLSRAVVALLAALD
jgi:2-dehydropantoate 2-reductase